MKADILILAAGFGKRLGALTANKPKPLIEVAERPLIDRILSKVSAEGFSRVMINLHYLPDAIRNYVGDGSRWGLEVVYLFEPVILDTGGAIKNAESEMKTQTLITINSDILIGEEFSICALLSAHLNNPQQPLATLVLRKHPQPETLGVIGIDSVGKICSFLDVDYFGISPSQRLIYTGIQVLSRAIFMHMPAKGEIFSITRDTYRAVLEKKLYLSSYLYNGYWSDAGTLASLAEAEREFKERK